MRRSSALLLSFVLLVAVASPVAAAGGGSHLAGSFQYSPFHDFPTREVSISAHGGQVHGTWEWTSLTDGVTRSGTITCLVVDGQEAWAAGPETASTAEPTAGAFFRIHDGGAPGVLTDAAVAWIADPGQTLGELEAWCTERSEEVPTFPIDSGNLTIRGT